MKRGTSLARSLCSGLAALLFTLPAWCDTIKVVKIMSRTTANDMHVTFFGKTDTTEPNNPRSVARTNYPSDLFDTATGLGTETLSFKDGTIMGPQQDSFRVKIKGDPDKNAPIIQKVEFTINGETSFTLKPGEGTFSSDVKGFTNWEYFDFSDVTAAQLVLVGEPMFNVNVTLYNLAVYVDLPLANFTLDSYEDASQGSLVYSTCQLTIAAGSAVTIYSLGAVQPGTYALATADLIQVDNWDTGETIIFDGPVSFAQDVPSP